MSLLMLNCSMIIMLMMLLIIILNLVAKKSFSDREKSSPFECGFDPKSSSRTPFSLHFFLIALIFLIFDIEITILFPLIITLKFSNPFSYFMFSILFLLILLLGLIHEWIQGALNWSH
uniref:NADH-ubiquinone oxidoreductase chain 3 n=1 Tax=Spinolyprops cribricollis TaxID=2984372 RepID=A0A978AXN3_9CUCU|nr:NADH dehydrogenase subunit 3 [Spinolyprops cribricollis]UYB79062.1 NADH dehydrogenase subunit 3 [Spinolyprops cribricollis]